MYSMPVARITSTMKSEPARPPSGDASFGASVSTAIWCAVGGSTVGSFSTAVGTVAALPVVAAADAAAPVTATPVKNLRRLTSG